MALEVLTLTDSVSGSSAKILPGFGFNCFSFQVATPRETVEVLWSHPEFATGTQRATRSGIPLLFPFAGRIRGTSFRYGGREYPLEVGDDFGNAIHGFVLDRAWRVIDRADNRAVGEFQASMDAPELLKRWPADFCIRCSYTLAQNHLASEITVLNPGDKELPFGLGTHGYFKVPLGASGAARDCVVSVPITTDWELAGLLPTGKVEPAQLAGELNKGMQIGDVKLDNVFGGLQFSGDWCTSTIHDRANKRRLNVSGNRAFHFCVVFNPPHREAICIEPYTTAPNPFELVEKGIDPQLRVLGPGESFSASVQMQLDEVG